MRKVLVCSTYPVENARHGGQLRTKAIIDKLKEYGHQVAHLCIFESGGYESQVADHFNIPLNIDFLSSLAKSDGRTDVDASAYFFQSDDHFLQLINAINICEPDCIFVNQPWLWPAIKAALFWLKSTDRVRIVYSSHNVESHLIKSLLAESNSSSATRLIRKTAEIEEDLVKSAHSVICVSRRDANYFKSRSSRVILAPNAIQPRGEPGGIDYWRKVYHGIRFALLVGSAHPPNAVGFTTMLAPHLGFLAPDERILVVGGACHLIPHQPLFKRNSGLNRARIDFLGVQNEGGLSTFIELSAAIILPITQGGGTNIKTAEAIYNRKTIIATSEAFRGYEDYLDLPFVHIADDPNAFRGKLKECLSINLMTHSVSEEDADRLDNLTWTKALRLVSQSVL